MGDRANQSPRRGGLSHGIVNKAREQLARLREAAGHVGETLQPPCPVPVPVVVRVGPRQRRRR